MSAFFASFHSLSFLRSVQHADVIIADGNTEGTAPITPVGPRAMVLTRGIMCRSNAARDFHAVVSLDGADTLRAVRDGNSRVLTVGVTVLDFT